MLQTFYSQHVHQTPYAKKRSHLGVRLGFENRGVSVSPSTSPGFHPPRFSTRNPCWPFWQWQLAPAQPYSRSWPPRLYRTGAKSLALLPSAKKLDQAPGDAPTRCEWYEKWDPYKWPIIDKWMGLQLDFFHPFLSGVIPSYVTGFPGPHHANDEGRRPE